eukprot:8587573-Pyramimonas_sp.AAC.1
MPSNGCASPRAFHGCQNRLERLPEHRARIGDTSPIHWRLAPGSETRRSTAGWAIRPLSAMSRRL